MGPDSLPAEWFTDELQYKNMMQTMVNLDYCSVEFHYKPTGGIVDIYIRKLKSLDLILSDEGDTYSPSVYVNSYQSGSKYPAAKCYIEENIIDSASFIAANPLNWSDFFKVDSYNMGFVVYSDKKYSGDTYRTASVVCTSDGRLVKVYKNASAFKSYNKKNQLYYATNNWVNYDVAVDNSTTISADEYYYYTDESTNLYQEIQNNIDNSIANEDSSVTITETYIQNIVNNTYTEINNNIPEYVPDNGGTGDDAGDNSGNTGDDSGNTGDDSGVSDNDTGTGGNGVGDFLSGLTAILDMLLSLVGKVMSIVADFSQSILNLFSGLTTFTDGFSDFLAGAFGFIPAEVWDIIKVGLSLAVLAGIIKFFRN